MTNAQLKKIIPLVESAIMRVDLFGRTWVTIWYGDIADSVIVTEENKELFDEMFERLESRNGKSDNAQN